MKAKYSYSDGRDEITCVLHVMNLSRNTDRRYVINKPLPNDDENANSAAIISALETDTLDWDYNLDERVRDRLGGVRVDLDTKTPELVFWFELRD